MRRPGAILVIVCLMLAPASVAEAETTIRFVNALPGAEEATLTAGGEELASAAFGEGSRPAAIAPGTARLTASGSDESLSRATQRLEAGTAYTAISMADGPGLQVLEDGPAEPGMARLRVVHAAPELGEPAIELDGEVIANEVQFGTVGEYETLDPGGYRLAVVDGRSGDALIAAQRVPLAAGTATTAVVVGSRGEMARVVTLDDASAAPPRAPQTGYGGLASASEGNRTWVAAALALVSLAAFATAARRLAGLRTGAGGR